MNFLTFVTYKLNHIRYIDGIIFYAVYRNMVNYISLAADEVSPDILSPPIMSFYVMQIGMVKPWFHYKAMNGLNIQMT